MIFENYFIIYDQRVLIKFLLDDDIIYHQFLKKVTFEKKILYE